MKIPIFVSSRSWGASTRHWRKGDPSGRFFQEQIWYLPIGYEIGKGYIDDDAGSKRARSCWGKSWGKIRDCRQDEVNGAVPGTDSPGNRFEYWGHQFTIIISLPRQIQISVAAKGNILPRESREWTPTTASYRWYGNFPSWIWTFHFIILLILLDSAIRDDTAELS